MGPLIRDVSIATAAVQDRFDLRTDVEYAASFIPTIVHVAAIAIFIGKVVGRTRKPVGKLFESVVTIPTTITIIATVIPVIVTVVDTI